MSSISDTYVLASKVKTRLTREAVKTDVNLHRLVCQANLLDNLIEYLNEQQTKKANASAAATTTVSFESIATSKDGVSSMTTELDDYDSDDDSDEDSDLDSEDSEDYEYDYDEYDSEDDSYDYESESDDEDDEAEDDEEDDVPVETQYSFTFDDEDNKFIEVQSHYESDVSDDDYNTTNRKTLLTLSTIPLLLPQFITFQIPQLLQPQ
ncbi:unnamed protein product [Ambrosiozyma monospora]|uniref:Unnamed protein product n=1 Tax=Ambrosiozyma monospora TaxID=43982 RepID=A0ACB5U3Z9_AMBMO|nr:unnamed protein product [Ambrosiozyma monospora]